MKSRLPAALIVEMDTALFDGVGVRDRAFSALVDTLQDAARTRGALLARFRAVHERHGSTEYPFVLAELSSHNSDEPFSPDLLREAAARYRAAAEAELTTYPLVRETLAWFGAHGTLVVAVSDARVDMAGPRLRQLGLDGLVDMLYAPEVWEPWEPRSTDERTTDERATDERATDDRALDDMSIDDALVLWPYGLPPLDATIARPLVGAIKPLPDRLRVILADLDVLPDEALFVGRHAEVDAAIAPRVAIVDSLADLRARGEPLTPSRG